ncbi:hemerythrin domain-containing protein [Streptomyces sp. NPDC015130]|uniref:hemerythrin domain-containing protein n=1 Tax=Streptomyces sp. NPDC015130 TaxID=3364940 RepID=UPI0037032395
MTAKTDRTQDHDVIAVIIEDHRAMEDLFRRMRSNAEDRSAAREEFSALLVAHSEAEEAEVYGALKRFRGVDSEDVEHGAEEHADGTKALLALLEVDDVRSEEWDTRLEELVEAVSHHLDEEERTVLNEARAGVPEGRRAELGAAFQKERARQLAAGCGSLENVRGLVHG